MSKALDYIIILVLIVIIAISPWFYGSVGLPQKYLIHLASLTILLLWLLKKNISSKEVNLYPAYLPLFCLLVLSTISIAFSVYRYTSILETLNLLSYIIIFFMVTQTVNNEKRLALFIWAINITGLFYCSYGIMQYYGYLPRTFWAEDRSLSSRFVNSGSFGAFVNMNIFLGMGLASAHKRALVKIVSILFVCIFIVALILSKSRISWLVFMSTLILFTVLCLKKPHLIKIKGFIFIALFILILVYILLHFKALLWERIYVAVPTQFQSLRQRIDVWRGTVRIILNHPFGVGMGNFQHIYPTYRTHSDRFLVDYAHSDFLQVASELGIVGLATFAWFIIRSLKSAFKSLFTLANYKFFLTTGLICAVLSFVFQAIFDFPLHIPANAILFFLTFGLLLGLMPHSNPKTFLLNKYINIFVIIVIIIGIALFTNIRLANKYYRLAKISVSKIDWQEAISGYNKAIKFMPINADSYADRGRVYALKSALAFSPEKIEYRKAALSDFLRATKLNPYQADYYLNLAWLYVDDNKHKGAINAFRKAIETNPTNGEFYYSYADYCLEHNLLDEALKTYRMALSLFINDDGRFVRLYGSGISCVFDKIYGYTQQYDYLKLAVPDTLNAHLAFARFLEGKGKYPEAYIEYKEALSKDPNNAEAKKAIDRRKGE